MISDQAENCESQSTMTIPASHDSQSMALPNGVIQSNTAALDRHLLKKDQVPIIFCEPFVDTGYRPLNQPWSFYLKSIFSLHNESMNVWTHLLGMTLMLLKLTALIQKEDIVNDPYTWPLCTGILSGAILYGVSSTAHCLHARSVLMHYVAFMCDFAAVGVYGLGSVMVHELYCSEDVFYKPTNWFFVPLGCVFASMICFCCCYAKVTFTRPYPFMKKVWQMFPVACIYVLLVSPIVHRLASCYVLGIDCTPSIPYHTQQIAWFIVSAFFFASEIPQRWLPGWCDYFLHSHQLFHLCIMQCTLIQMDGVYIDFKTRNDVVRSRATPTLTSAFGPLFLVLLSNAVCIVVFGRYTKRTLLKKSN